LQAWVWVQGGAYFGVPVTNFFGWFSTVYIIYQSFALYSWGQPTISDSLPASYWRHAVLFYGVSAGGNLLLVLPQTRLSVVTDATGVQWSLSAITETCAAVTIFTMGAFAILAWLRIQEDAAVN
jgi:hypothetical protein